MRVRCGAFGTDHHPRYIHTAPSKDGVDYSRAVIQLSVEIDILIEWALEMGPPPVRKEGVMVQIIVLPEGRAQGMILPNETEAVALQPEAITAARRTPTGS